MYRDHVPIIAGAMTRNLVTFKRGVMFAVLSARTRFTLVPEQMKQLELGKHKAQCLWSWKIDAYAYLEDHAETLWNTMLVAPDAKTALWDITRVPGLGLVKGAFVCQLMGFDVACLDTRNIGADNRPRRQYRSDGLKDGAAWRRKIDRYLADVGGEAEYYWNSWCELVAPDYALTAEQISWMHVKTIVPAKQRRKPPECFQFRPKPAIAEIPF